MSLTLVEKIATRYAVGLKPGDSVRQGMIIRIRPKHVMTHDNTGAVIPKFRSVFEGTGKEPRIADPGQPVFAIDHDIQNHTPENLGKYANIAAFAEEHGIDYYPPGTGISHQVMVEQGYAVPGSMIVGSDSHSNLYGGVAALGTPVVRTDAACLWATGQTWWQVPPVARCVLNGRLQEGVVGKDVIIALCGLFNQDEVLNHAVEFVGDGVEHLSMDQRLSIANMTTEWGALAGVFPFDETLRSYLFARADYFAGSRRPGERRSSTRGSYTRHEVEEWWEQRLAADIDANYALELELDLGSVIPHVAGPNEVKTMVSVPEMEARRVKIQKAYLVSCVNARLEDMESAAGVLRGRRIAEGVEMYVGAASEEVQRAAEASGAWDALVEAGAITLPPGCGPCIGLGAGLVRDGEVAISATNRNFKGRMGSKNAEVYLASPAVVAASAEKGYICAPGPYKSTRPIGTARARAGGPQRAAIPEIIDGFPQVIKGRVLFLPHDNMNTDGIFAGKWTYKDSMLPEEMAQVVFENYDPGFGQLAREGDIVVSGRNFGTGSSREQAATALKYRGIACVIAASFSETYLRNAFNNGYLCLVCLPLYEHLCSEFAAECAKTIVASELELRFDQGRIYYNGQAYDFTAPSVVAQELIVRGGAEAVARTAIE